MLVSKTSNILSTIVASLLLSTNSSVFGYVPRDQEDSGNGNGNETTMFIPNNFTLSANARIINGSPAALQEFPYAVFIYSEVSRSAEVCTGSLIADNVVVTAAHCLLYNLSYTFSPSQMLVSAGSVSNIRNNYDRYKVSKVIPHPQFSKASLRNDIGLIILSSPVPSSKATPATIYNESVKDNMNVIAAGWGVTSNDEDATSASVLNKVPLVTSSSATCKTLNPFWSSNSGSSICTLNVSGQDTCYGDSGGPLAYPVNGANYLVGLTSLGNAPGSENSDDPPICGAEGGAGYYTRVAYYLDWIVQVTGLTKDQLLTPGSNATSTADSSSDSSGISSRLISDSTSSNRSTSSKSDTSFSPKTAHMAKYFVFVPVITQILASLLM